MPISSIQQIFAAAGRAEIVGVADATALHRASHRPKVATMMCSSDPIAVAAVAAAVAAVVDVAVAVAAVADGDSANRNRCPRRDCVDVFQGNDPDTARMNALCSVWSDAINQSIMRNDQVNQKRKEQYK